MNTAINNSEQFALTFYGSVALEKALKQANEGNAIEKAAMLEAIVTVLLQHPQPAEA
jgi:hypothetical protein